MDLAWQPGEGHEDALRIEMTTQIDRGISQSFLIDDPVGWIKPPDKETGQAIQAPIKIHAFLHILQDR